MTNDELARRPIVLVTEPGPGAVRAEERGAFRFVPHGRDGVADAQGRPWRVAEAALRGPAGESLARLPGHLAYWFGWFSFYPRTQLYGSHR